MRHGQGARRAQGGAASGSSRRAERDRRALLAQFVLWRRPSAGEARADAEAAQVETLLRLKGDQLESPDPTYWTEELLDSLLTQVVPRKMVQPREEAMLLVPALTGFLEFLASRRRWHRASIDPARARTVLEQLEFSVLEAAEDPDRRSFSGNILNYAASLGVQLEDQQELADFMEWYNTALTDGERHELTDTGRLANPGRPFTSGTSGPSPRPTGGSAFFPPPPGGDGAGADPVDDEWDDAAEGLGAPDWPWFLPDPDEERADWPEEDGEAAEEDGEAAEDPAAFAALHARVPLVPRAVRLLELVGEGRAITATGALRRADVHTLVQKWGLESGSEQISSMWDVPELVGPWTALIAGGWIELTSTRARPGEAATPYVAAEEDPEGFVQFARALLGILLLTMSQQEAEHGGLEGGADTFASLFYVTSADGLVLPDVLHDGTDMPRVPRGPDGGPDLDEALRLMYTTSDLVRLTAYGILHRDAERAAPDTHFSANLAVMGVVVSTADLLFHGPDQE
ncbi:hypothetical protein [Brachybacterium sacelli]